MIDRALIKAGCYAVIFSYVRGTDLEGYAEMDETTLRLASSVPGYLGYESTGDENRRIFISYWESMKAIEDWKANQTHRHAKSKAKQWYQSYHSMVTRIEHNTLHEG